MSETIDPKNLLAKADFIPHWDDSVTDDQYHADKTCVGSSQLRKILDSPKAFYWSFFKGLKEEETEAFRLGKIIHKAVLEGSKFRDSYIVMPEFGDQRSKENKAAKVKWFADLPKDKIAVTQDHLDMLIGIIDSVMSHPQGPDLLKNGKSEVAGYYVDQKTGIKIRIKPDFLSFNLAIMVDLKSTRNSERRKFMSSVYDYRYDFQMLTYSEGTKAITGKRPEMNTMIAVEKKPPYECAIYYFNDFSLEYAGADYRKALDTLKWCIDNNKWPQRQKSIEPCEIPGWFSYNNAEEEHE